MFIIYTIITYTLRIKTNMYMNKSYIIVYIQLVRHLMSCPEIITLVIDL